MKRLLPLAAALVLIPTAPVHAQLFGGDTEARNQVFQLRQHSLAALVHALAIGREGDLPRGAVKQLDPQAVLQPLHRLRYGGGGSAQLPSGCGKTALLGGFGECDELLKSRHIRGVIMLIEEFMSLMLRCSCAFSKRACLVTLRTPYHFNWKEREPSHANPCPA